MHTYLFIDDNMNVIEVSAYSEDEALFDIEQITSRAAHEFSFVVLP